MTSRRAACARCGRPAVACWCDCIRVVSNRCRLLILQHPDEQSHAKGTARLLAQCLTQAELRVGEHFDAPASTEGFALLYPDTPGGASLATARPWPADNAIHTLVALDGTWRKSRKLLHLNPWLQALPRLALPAPPPSRYAIRRAQAPQQRSTLEACALALALLDGDEARYAPLWAALDDFVAQQQALGRTTHSQAPTKQNGPSP